jgi:hypothetical protein
VGTADNNLLTDNPLLIGVPIVGPANPAVLSGAEGQLLWMLLVKANDANTFQKARTLLTPVPRAENDRRRARL